MDSGIEGLLQTWPRALFDDKEIAWTQGCLTHLNQYHVINFDIIGFISDAAEMDLPFSKVPNMIADAVYKELAESYPELEEKSLKDAMIGYVEKSGRKLVFIIDEWDALIREAKQDAAVQRKYLNFLRGWFKNSSFKPKAVAALLTGILPIKKDGCQSAISDLIECPILDPDGFAAFTGFTKVEVKRLYAFKSRDDVLTLLIHLGYLTWNGEEWMARIPNEEVRAEFRKINGISPLRERYG